MKIYLDIDGVLLANDKALANHAEEFIKRVVSKYPTYWLTTHAMDEDTSLAVRNVGQFCSPETVELLKKIKPAPWSVAKTEAIDFGEPFLWLDDDLYEDEREELIKHNALDSWVEVDLMKDENHLAKLMSLV
jgi:hypothetical protein